MLLSGFLSVVIAGLICASQVLNRNLWTDFQRLRGSIRKEEGAKKGESAKKGEYAKKEEAAKKGEGAKKGEIAKERETAKKVE